MAGEPYPMVPRRTPLAMFLRCGWASTNGGPHGTHIHSTWSHSRSTIFLAVRALLDRAGRLPELDRQLVDAGPLTLKKLFVDFECVYTYARSSRPTAWPDWTPQAIPSHVPSTYRP